MKITINGKSIFKFRKRKRKDNSYYYAIIKKAYLLAMFWCEEIKRISNKSAEYSKNNDFVRLEIAEKRARRILNHIYRIRQVQLRAEAKTK